MLQRRLQRVFPRTAADLIADAVEDALLEYARRPDRFDPSRDVPLERYLFTAASRNLINALDSERRRREREARCGEVMLAAKLEATLDELEAVRELETKLESSVVASSKHERAAVHLWLAGERRTQALAEALALSHLTFHNQRVEVKRFKDRILKRCLRLWHHH